MLEDDKDRRAPLIALRSACSASSVRRGISFIVSCAAQGSVIQACNSERVPSGCPHGAIDGPPQRVRPHAGAERIGSERQKAVLGQYVAVSKGAKMRQKSGPEKEPPEQVVREIRRTTRRQFSTEEKIRIDLSGLRGEDTIAELCRREDIVQTSITAGQKNFSRPKRGAWPVIRRGPQPPTRLENCGGKPVR
jgi:hypothetical protein